jgi:hypothetical protein
LILRHDLDMSIQAAIPIAKIEKSLGVVSTYFVLLRTEMYNPYSAAGRHDLLHLLELDHDLGLHLDASNYRDDDQSLERAVAFECDALEALIGRPVETVSFHRPTESLLDGRDRIAGRRHTYENFFFKEMAYCSDSRGAWRHGHPLDLPAIADGRALQLLTHPIWWNATAGEGVQEKLDRFASLRYRLLREELGRNCETYDATRPSPTEEVE